MSGEDTSGARHVASGSRSGTVALQNGSQIWFKATGAGAPLFQIHGSLFGHANFHLLSPLLMPHYEVVDFDLPGYGDSPAASHGGGIHAWADDVALLIRTLGYERAHVHGTSLGALVGLSLAARHPDVVDHLVLSCFVCRYDEFAKVMRSTWMTAARDSGMAEVADLTAVAGFSRGYFEREDALAELAFMRAAFARNEASAFIAATQSILDLDLESFIDDVKAPLLLIGADEDNMTPVRPAASGYGMEQFGKRAAQAQFEMIPECGHYMVLEKPEQTAAHILSFVPRN